MSLFSVADACVLTYLVVVCAEDPGLDEADPLPGARPLLGRPGHCLPHQQVLLGLRGEHALRGAARVVRHARVEGGLGGV